MTMYLSKVDTRDFKAKIILFFFFLERVRERACGGGAEGKREKES